VTTRIHESSFLAGRFAPSVRRRAMATSEPNGKNLSLTPLEKQIMALVLAGYTSKESGQIIGVSRPSVRHHVRSIMAKLGVANRLELALYALHHHLIVPVQILPRKSPRVIEARLSRTLRAKRAA